MLLNTLEWVVAGRTHPKIRVKLVKTFRKRRKLCERVGKLSKMSKNFSCQLDEIRKRLDGAELDGAESFSKKVP